MPDPGSSTRYKGRSVFPEWAIRVKLDSTPPSVLEIPVAWSRLVARRLRLAEPPAGMARSKLPVVLRANELDDATLARLWDAVAATPEKEGIIASLQRIEPSVRDIDLRAEPHFGFRSRVAVRLSNGEGAAAPIGSLGQGSTWLFALALGAAATPNRLLIVDDIDAGLHHRVMHDMWAMVIEGARRRDLQVFATTHSIDCLTALRRACDRDDKQGDDVRVVRLVKGGRSGITFTAEELATAIEGEVEVRG